MGKVTCGQTVKLPSGHLVKVTDVSMTKRGQMFWFQIEGETRWMFASEVP